MDIVQINKFSEDQVKELYTSVGWEAYTEDMDSLMLALKNSSYVFGIYEDSQLVAVIRGLTDQVAINYIQDIIVHPKLQGRGIGSLLLQFINEKYPVRAEVLVTDDDPGQLAYYKKNGFSNTKDLKEIPLNCFTKYRGLELK